MRSDCPICLEYLFDSVRRAAVLPCGHTVHADCLEVRFEPILFAQSALEGNFTLSRICTGLEGISEHYHLTSLQEISVSFLSL